MNDIIEAMISGHDNTKYNWISGKCAETCVQCETNDEWIKPMRQWQAEGVPQTLGNTNCHKCGDDCSCGLEIVY